jgi:hypothetical protein
MVVSGFRKGSQVEERKQLARDNRGLSVIIIVNMKMQVCVSLSILVGMAAAWLPAPNLRMTRQVFWRCEIKAPTHIDRFQTAQHYSNGTNHNHEMEYESFSSMTRETRRSWNDSFKALETYKMIYNNCDVPPRYSPDQALARWVATQRQRRNKMSEKHKKALDDIGFDWKLSAWDEMFEKLQVYRVKHGDCCVPTNWEEDPALAHWVTVQRVKHHKLPNGKLNALSDINFAWDRYETKWLEMYQKLQHYHNVHGHCLVSRNKLQDPAFYQWIKQQRFKYAKGKLSPDRIKKLNQLDFAWSVGAKSSNVTESTAHKPRVVPADKSAANSLSRMGTTIKQIATVKPPKAFATESAAKPSNVMEDFTATDRVAVEPLTILAENSAENSLNRTELVALPVDALDANISEQSLSQSTTDTAATNPSAVEHSEMLANRFSALNRSDSAATNTVAILPLVAEDSTSEAVHSKEVVVTNAAFLNPVPANELAANSLDTTDKMPTDAIIEKPPSANVQEAAWFSSKPIVAALSASDTTAFAMNRLITAEPPHATEPTWLDGYLKLAFALNRLTTAEPPHATEPTWLNGYFKIVAYNQKYGHCETSEAMEEADPYLVAWANEQRSLLKNGSLKPNRMDLLNGLRFPWYIRGDSVRQQSRRIGNK